MAEIASIQPECPICLEKDADMCLPCGGYLAIILFTFFHIIGSKSKGN